MSNNVSLIERDFFHLIILNLTCTSTWATIMNSHCSNHFCVRINVCHICMLTHMHSPYFSLYLKSIGIELHINQRNKASGFSQKPDEMSVFVKVTFMRGNYRKWKRIKKNGPFLESGCIGIGVCQPSNFSFFRPILKGQLCTWPLFLHLPTL